MQKELQKYRKKFRNQKSIVIYIQKDKHIIDKIIGNINIYNLYVETHEENTNNDLCYVEKIQK